MPRIVITEPGKPGQPYRFDLKHKLTSIGRRSDSDIVLKCPSISGQHCTMERVKGGFILRDQDSTNGIKLDGKRMQIIDLEDGMKLSLGDATMEFQLSEDESSTLSKEDFTPHQKQKQNPSSNAAKAKAADDIALKENTRVAEKKTPATKDETAASRSRHSAKDEDEDIVGLIDPDSGKAMKRPPVTSGFNQPVAQSGGGAAKPLLVFILIMAAVFTGMTISHKLRTGDSLPNKAIDVLIRKPDAEKNASPDNSSESETP
ncbi:MAG: FHA domain-containing protein [Akkermansiaceae bacterium]